MSKIKITRSCTKSSICYIDEISKSKSVLSVAIKLEVVADGDALKGVIKDMYKMSLDHLS
jgi:hypothetical protein